MNKLNRRKKRESKKSDGEKGRKGKGKEKALKWKGKVHIKEKREGTVKSKEK